MLREPVARLKPVTISVGQVEVPKLPPPEGDTYTKLQLDADEPAVGNVMVIVVLPLVQLV